MGPCPLNVSKKVEFVKNDILDGKIENDKITFHVFSQLLGRRVKGLWDGTIVKDKIALLFSFQQTVLTLLPGKLRLMKKVR